MLQRTRLGSFVGTAAIGRVTASVRSHPDSDKPGHPAGGGYAEKKQSALQLLRRNTIVRFFNQSGHSARRLDARYQRIL